MKLFVSSTTRDLGEARRKVCERLLQLRHQPMSMDYYASCPAPPGILDDREAAGCDACVIIVGPLYGECPRCSITP